LNRFRRTYCQSIPDVKKESGSDSNKMSQINSSNDPDSTNIDEEVRPLQNIASREVCIESNGKSNKKRVKEVVALQLKEAPGASNLEISSIENKVVKKARSAFVFYQADYLSKIRAELGSGSSMGEAMNLVSDPTSKQNFWLQLVGSSTHFGCQTSK
jgi:hypothetical protein